MKLNFLLALCGILLSGCTEPCPNYNRLDVAPFNGGGTIIKKPYGAVMPYYSEADIKREYEPIGFMSCDGNVREEASILRAMLYRAADMGADGILLNAHGFAQQETVNYPPGTVPLTRDGISPNQVNAQRLDVNIKWGWMALIGNSPDRCIFRAQAIRFKK